MKEPIIQTWDDLVLKEQHEKVPADNTVVFGYQGEYYEIDLTANHAIEFGKYMARYVGAATKIDGMPRKRKPNKRHPDAYYQDMRAFADKQDDPKMKYRQEEDGKFFYPAPLRRAFEEWRSEVGEFTR